ncbi:hypothetical protein GCM10009579_63710 [Streptomyces javensis]|uniref:Transposase n=1 Tax=Streptomyces javensis TaxID=114698 RepID=A0ABN1X803_9ACTN
MRGYEVPPAVGPAAVRDPAASGSPREPSPGELEQFFHLGGYRDFAAGEVELREYLAARVWIYSCFRGRKL